MMARTAEQAAAAHLRAATLVIALGGGIGSVLRYALARAIPVHGHGFPVATLVTNLAGSLLLGALVVAVTEIWRRIRCAATAGHRRARRIHHLLHLRRASPRTTGRDLDDLRPRVSCGRVVRRRRRHGADPTR